jgi:hypothetical protein
VPPEIWETVQSTERRGQETCAEERDLARPMRNEDAAKTFRGYNLVDEKRRARPDLAIGADRSRPTCHCVPSPVTET